MSCRAYRAGATWRTTRKDSTMTDTTKATEHKTAWNATSSAQLEIEIVIHALEWLSDEVVSDSYDPDILAVFIEGTIAKAQEAHSDVSDALELLREKA